MKSLFAVMMMVCLVAVQTNDCLARARRAPAAYATYTNEKYGFSISYPVGVLTPQPVSSSGDGRKFLSRDKRTEALAYCWGNAMSRTVKQEMDNRERLLGLKATYRRLAKSWFALSGYEHGRIYYMKVIYRHGFFTAFVIRYPKNQLRYWDPIVTRMEKSLVPYREETRDKASHASFRSHPETPPHLRAIAIPIDTYSIDKVRFRLGDVVDVYTVSRRNGHSHRRLVVKNARLSAPLFGFTGVHENSTDLRRNPYATLHVAVSDALKVIIMSQRTRFALIRRKSGSPPSSDFPERRRDHLIHR
jgi:hypothetical protein